VRITYLDHAATTPVRSSALEAMLPFFTERFANPSGSHRFARDARKALDEARDRVASAIGVQPGEVVFTGCGSESNNTVIAGVSGRALCSAAEHHAVLHPIEERGGIIVGVDSSGHIRLDELDAALTAAAGDVGLVSVMAVNNEVGTITDLSSVARLVRRLAPQALLHTDAVQAPSWVDLRTIAPLVDLMSFSAHKFGGPKGVGVLTIRNGVKITPLITGGGQERERRSGTHNVAGVVALAEALDVTHRERQEELVRISGLRNQLVDHLVDACDGITETVPRDRKVVGSAHVCIEGIESESLLFLLDEANVCASAASACASGAMEPSHVLAAMGVSRARSAGALRLTLGHTTTIDDVGRATDVITAAVRQLRKTPVLR